MIKINLLPADIQVTERKINPNYFIAGTGLVLVLVLIPFSVAQYSRRNSLRSDVEKSKMELERFKPIVAQVEELESAKAQLEQRKSIIETLESERLRYPYFMEDFIKLLPNNVWLTNLSTTLPPDGASITVAFDMTALDHYAVADMVSNLETSQIFADVDVGPITAATTPTGQAITFHISTLYKKAPNANAIKKS